jgi:hypothetical protein
MADRVSTSLVDGGGYGQLAEVWSDLERRLTVNLSVNVVVGQVLGGGTAG